MADDLTLVVGGRKISGWTDIRVTRGIERMPSDFDMTLTEKYPTDPGALVVQAGDPCQVMLGGDIVVTGYVDLFRPGFSEREHTITIAGRSKSEDLVDCSAEWPSSQISGSSALEIATKLAKPYGITVDAKVDTGAPIPVFPLNIGETVYAIIERVARWRGLLIYDLADGNITLNQAGSEKMGSGAIQGKNVLRATATYDNSQRFSEYDIFLMSVDLFSDQGDAPNALQKVPDSGVKRYRLRNIIAENSSDPGLDVAKKRGLWEAARRAGRGNRLDITVDAWRDTAGKLWTINASIPIELPGLKVPKEDWIISEVTFRKGPGGTTADLVVMPKAAFVPEPILIQPVPPDV